MNSKDDILQVYIALKDCLENDDDFEKMYNLIQAMASKEPQKAFDMWYPLLSKYENIITECQPNATYYLTNQNLDVLGEAFGYSKFDNIIISDHYLYDLLFRRFCYAGNHYNYTQGMMIRAMSNSNMALAEKMFEDVYSNGNNDASWFDIMDGFMFEVKVGDFLLNDSSKALLSRWSSKIKDTKEKAKIMSAMLATGQNFDLSVFSENDKTRSTSSKIIDTTGMTAPLIRLIEEHPEALNSRQVLRAMLSDYYSQNKLFINALLMAYDEGLVTELQSVKTIDYFAEQRMQTVLTNNYGISMELADSIIQSWKHSLKK